MNPLRQKFRSDRCSGWPVVCLLLLCLLGSCGRNPPKSAPAFQPGLAADPELAAENRLQQLLGRLNARQNEVAALIRVAGPELAPEKQQAARAARYGFYSGDKYVAALHAAETAVSNKMTAFALERAILENVADAALPATNRPPTGAAINAQPGERTGEMNLKAALIELQNQMRDLSLTEPPPGRVPAQVREKAAAARDDLFSPDQYAECLGAAIALMEGKLRGLDAEAAIYEDLLGLNSKPGGKR